MDIVIKLGQLFLSLSLLVVIHEFGHFMFARMFGIRVEKFYLFFNLWFSIFKFRKGDTEYGMGWIPFGGYVKISGMIDESMDKEQMKQPPKPYEFRSKPAWQRLLVMVGGVLMNVILAIVIYIGVSMYWGDSYISAKDVKAGFAFSDTAREIGFRNGDRVVSIGGQEVDDFAKILPSIVLDDASYVDVERDGELVRLPIDDEYIPRLLNDKRFIELRFPLVVNAVIPDLPAALAGVQAGDSLIALNGQPVKYFDEFRQIVAANKGNALAMSLIRGSDTVVSNVTVDENGLIGIESSADYSKYYPIRTKDYGLAEAIPVGFTRTFDGLNNYIKQVKLIFSPETEAYKSVGGFITIGKFFPSQWDWLSFWQITAFLSIILAIMNILPIPALDGGHVLFLLYEMVARRAPSEKFMEYAQMSGMMILLALLVFANGNDLMRLFQ